MEDKENRLPVEEHNASFDDDPILDSADLSEDELQDTLLADSDMNGFQRFIAKMDDKKWALTQRILGIVLGVGAGLALFGEGLFGSGESNDPMGTYSLVLAVVIALLVPNIIEKQGGRKINLARMTMAATLLVVLVAYFIYAGASSGFKFTTN